MTTLPIILLHRGDGFYLSHSIAQVRQSNPGARLILLGDRGNAYYRGVEHHPYAAYFEGAARFATIYEHVNRNADHYSWILFCFQKWFVLRDFLEAQNLRRCLVIDSDVLLFEPVDAVVPWVESYATTLSCSHAGGPAHSAIAFIFDPAIVDALCRIMEEMFAGGKLDRTLFPQADQEGSDFGIVEMHALGLLLERHPSRVLNTYQVVQGHVFQHHLEEPGLCEMEHGFQKIIWREGRPWCKRLNQEEYLPYFAMHFVGSTKKMMPRYLTLSDAQIKWDWRLNRLACRALKYPKRWINTLSRREVFPGI